MIHEPLVTDVHGVARRLVGARLRARALEAFPGSQPTDMATAYRCQDAAIDRWPDEICGWKVGGVPADQQATLGAAHVAGPIFRRQLLRANAGGEVDFPVFQGGFAAVEAEYVVVLSRDVAPRHRTWSTLEAREVVRDLCCGIETAGSPLRAINALGATAVASDFGNNAGLIVGGCIDDWQARYPDDLTTETFVDGERVGRGGARSLPDGPLGFLAAALELLGSRGRWLRAGDVISTGATTGIHEIVAGQHARVVFSGVGEIRCRAIPAGRSEIRDAGSRI